MVLYALWVWTNLQHVSTIRVSYRQLAALRILRGEAFIPVPIGWLLPRGLRLLLFPRLAAPKLNETNQGTARIGEDAEK